LFITGILPSLRSTNPLSSDGYEKFFSFFRYSSASCPEKILRGCGEGFSAYCRVSTLAKMAVQTDGRHNSRSTERQHGIGSNPILDM
jgi:hypothetical protein